MKKFLQATLLSLLLTTWAVAQSALDGTSVQITTYNMPDSVGTVRLIDGDTNCRVDGGPNGDDKPSDEECVTIDSGGDPVTATFNGGAVTVGSASVTPVVSSFAGVAAGTIEVFNFATDTTVPLDWSQPGDLLEFTIRTADDSFPAGDVDDFWGFTATGIQYPNAAADSHVVLPYDEGPGNYTNFYYWFENKDGPITSGYEIGLPVGLGVGPHPTDPNREVVYPLYSGGQADEQTDTIAGGSLDFYSHGSILDANPLIGNTLVLAENSLSPDVFVDVLEDVTGVGFALLVLPPEMDSNGVAGDFNADGLLTATDIDLLSAQVGGNDTAFDLNMDGSVTAEDRSAWISLAGTIEGDADLNGMVEFADFLSLSAKFGQAGGWADGDFDGSADVQFADFLQLSSNFGKTAGVVAAAESVPEPSAGMLAAFGLLGILAMRRRM